MSEFPLMLIRDKGIIRLHKALWGHEVQRPRGPP